METIIYRDRRNREILNESAISDDLAYDKEYYIDEKPIKTESYIYGKFSGLQLYLQLSDAPEKLLNQFRHVETITLYQHRFSTGIYDLYDVDHFEYLKLKYSKIEVHSPRGRIAEYWVYPAKYYGTNSKTFNIHPKEEGQKKQIQVSYHGSGDFKTASVPGEKSIGSLEEFMSSDLIRKYGLAKRYYASLLPLIPDMQKPLPHRKVRYVSDFNNKPLTLQEALNTKYYTKKIYEDDVLMQTDEYLDGEFYKRKIYFYGEAYSRKSFHADANNVIYFNPKDVNNYVVWEAEYFNREGEFSKRWYEVRDHEGTKIAVQQISLESGKVTKTKKYSKQFYDDSEGYKPFTYDKDGAICKKIEIHDGFGSETYLISEMKENGFFDTEYGRYFLEPEPLIPSLKGPERVKGNVVYKNPFGGVIDETEAKHLYEYYKETYHNGFLKKSHHHGASRWSLEVYDDTATDTSKAYGLYFYNLKNVNGYRVYDAYGKDHYNDEPVTGNLVQDAYGREVSRVLRGHGKIQYGRKILYDGYMPVPSGSSQTHVLYDEDGKVSTYRKVRTKDNSVIESTRSAYESAKYFKNEKIAQEYYRSLDELMPPLPFVSDSQLIERPVASYDDSRGIRNITGLYTEQGKLRHIIDGYDKKYFLPKGEDIVNAIKALKPYSYTHFYFNIIEKGSNVFCHYAHLSGFLVQMRISKYTYQADVRITPDQREITVRLRDHHNNTNWYDFYKNDKFIRGTSFHSKELAKQLLQAI
ncbi:hypothetical protein AAEO56_09135 [Flavobacterium sp. DGU11]|uniref:Antitoxin component YwqK of the YwqJK toxin-antitoxin module n=1 Tax=Flavobacterium arundinis TaxID=3139143 RepID=A0ABU9HWV6_9FLAO